MFSQNKSISIEVIDIESHIGVPFATVQTFGDVIPTGSYCDSIGYCKLQFQNSLDSILISCIGYDNHIVKNLDSEASLRIELKPIKYTINELQVLPTKIEKLGGTKMRGFGKTHSAPHTLRTSYVQNDGYLNAYIEEMYFQLEKGVNYTKDCEDVVRLHLYSVTEDIKPGSELLPKDTLVFINLETELPLVIDISKYKLKFPESGVFIGYEYLGTYNKETKVISFLKCGDIMTINTITSDSSKISCISDLNNREWIQCKSGNKNKYFLFGISVKYR